jgi:cell division initiation protein
MKRDRVVTEIFGGEAVFNPSDLYNQDFKRSILGGYRSKEVDEFLRRVADVMESLIVQVRELKHQTEEYRTRLDQYQEMDGVLKNTLVTSQKFAEQAVAAAKEEARGLIETARLEQQRRLMEAVKLPAALAREIQHLQHERDRLRADIESVLVSHKTFLDRMSPIEESLSGKVFVVSEDTPMQPDGTLRDHPDQTEAQPK